MNPSSSTLLAPSESLNDAIEESKEPNAHTPITSNFEMLPIVVRLLAFGDSLTEGFDPDGYFDLCTRMP
jgi:hypothetical protein